MLSATPGARAQRPAGRPRPGGASKAANQSEPSSRSEVPRRRMEKRELIFDCRQMLHDAKRRYDEIELATDVECPRICLVEDHPLPHID